MTKKSKSSSDQTKIEEDLLRVNAQITSLSSKRSEDPELNELIKLLREKIRLQDKKIKLLDDTKSDLEDSNNRLKNDRARLRMELRLSMGFKEKKEKDDSPKEPNRQSGKRGAPIGHKGKTRPLPSSWEDERTESNPGKCSCGSEEVITLDEYDYKYIEDIIPARKTVTRIKYQKGLCRQCGKTFNHREAFPGPHVTVGKNLASHLVVLRQRGITFRQLSRICNDVLGIPLTPSGVLGIVSKTTDMLNPVYEQIAASLPEQKIIHADETGWKIRGDNHYLWVMCNRELAYFHVDKSRSSAIPENLLGKDYNGTVHCDFYAGYNFLSKTQRCLVHLLRDIKKERALLPGSIALQNFEDAFKSFLKKGKEIQKVEDKNLQQQEAESLKREMIRIGKMRMPTYGKGKNLTARILKYQEDIFRFVEDPELEWHNNRAERQIRPLVVARKMSFGSDTIEGARRNCVLHSVIETCTLNKMKSLDLVKDILLKKKNIPLPFIK